VHRLLLQEQEDGRADVTATGAPAGAATTGAEARAAEATEPAVAARAAARVLAVRVAATARVEARLEGSSGEVAPSGAAGYLWV